MPCANRSWSTYIDATPSLDAQWLHDAVFTLQAGREAWAERAGWIVASVEELRTRLQAYLQGANRRHRPRRSAKPAAEAHPRPAPSRQLRPYPFAHERYWFDTLARHM